MATETQVTKGKNPFLAAVITAITSCTLLGLAITYGWLGTDIGEGSKFCEALRGDLINQPANTWSNLGFIFVGLIIGYQGQKQTELMDGMVGFFACVVVLLGPASAAMHATGTATGQNLDLTSMFLISSFAASYAMKRWFDLTKAQFITTFLLWLAAGEIVLFAGVTVPIVLHGGNAVFAVGIVTAVLLEVRIWHRNPSRAVARAGMLTVGSLAAAFSIWLLDQGPWCDPNSLIQGHALWHILCAVAAYFQFRMYHADSLNNQTSEVSEAN